MLPPPYFTIGMMCEKLMNLQYKSCLEEYMYLSIIIQKTETNRSDRYALVAKTDRFNV